MFDKILLAVDGSETSRKAVPVAAGVARGSASEVVVCHVREREILAKAPETVMAEKSEEAMALVDNIVRELKDAGVNARPQVRTAAYGSVAREIRDLARSEGVGLIVMGSRGLGELSGLLIGSVTHKVLHLAECPVLVVR